jgi:hypothetical protein
MNAPGRRPATAKLQEDRMQPKPLHGAAPGFRVLNANAAAATARRHAGFPFARLAGEWDTIRRRPDGSIDMELYRRYIAAGRRVARERAALTSACVVVLAMTAIYLALFFAAAQTRASNHTHPATPISAPQIPNAAYLRL